MISHTCFSLSFASAVLYSENPVTSRSSSSRLSKDVRDGAIGWIPDAANSRSLALTDTMYSNMPAVYASRTPQEASAVLPAPPIPVNEVNGTSRVSKAGKDSITGTRAVNELIVVRADYSVTGLIDKKAGIGGDWTFSLPECADRIFTAKDSSFIADSERQISCIEVGAMPFDWGRGLELFECDSVRGNH